LVCYWFWTNKHPPQQDGTFFESDRSRRQFPLKLVVIIRVGSR